jgi:hypothetical protein
MAHPFILILWIVILDEVFEFVNLVAIAVSAVIVFRLLFIGEDLFQAFFAWFFVSVAAFQALELGLDYLVR